MLDDKYIYQNYASQFGWGFFVLDYLFFNLKNPNNKKPDYLWNDALYFQNEDLITIIGFENNIPIVTGLEEIDELGTVWDFKPFLDMRTKHLFFL